MSSNNKVAQRCRGVKLKSHSSLTLGASVHKETRPNVMHNKCCRGLFSNPFSIHKSCWCEELHAYSHWCGCCEHLVSTRKAGTWIHVRARIETCAHTQPLINIQTHNGNSVVPRLDTLTSIPAFSCSRALTTFQPAATQHSVSTQAHETPRTWVIHDSLRSPGQE